MLDQELILADNTAILAAVVNSDTIDSGSTKQPYHKIAKNVFTDGKVCLVITRGDTAWAGGTGIKVEILTGSAVDSSGDITSPVTIGEPVNITTLAALNASPYQYYIGTVPSGVDRYLQLKITPDGTFTAGTINAYVGVPPATSL